MIKKPLEHARAWNKMLPAYRTKKRKNILWLPERCKIHVPMSEGNRGNKKTGIWNLEVGTWNLELTRQNLVRHAQDGPRYLLFVLEVPIGEVGHQEALVVAEEVQQRVLDVQHVRVLRSVQ
jgi:hypothetical protein